MDSFNETPSGGLDGSNSTFTLAFAPITGSVHVYKRRLRMRPGAENDHAVEVPPQYGRYGFAPLLARLRLAGGWNRTNDLLPLNLRHPAAHGFAAIRCGEREAAIGEDRHVRLHHPPPHVVGLADQPPALVPEVAQ